MSKEEKLLLGGGCFWCMEGVYRRVKGVKSVVSGYAGGLGEQPSYKAVCSGTTGFAEVVEIVFDPTIVSVDNLLEVFWVVHDPTTLNAQGADKGTQYRSAIFYQNEAQKEAAQRSIKMASSMFDEAIVTELSPAPVFYAAEDYHQNYYDLNQHQGYCQVVIAPKIEKFMCHFGDKLAKQG